VKRFNLLLLLFPILLSAEEMYLLKEDFDASKKYAKLSLEKLSILEWIVQSEPERISRLQELADKN